LPFAGRRVQHETAIGLHRPAEVDRRIAQLVPFQRKRKTLEERLQRHVDGRLTTTPSAPWSLCSQI
jgi:hypothetical protein